MSTVFNLIKGTSKLTRKSTYIFLNQRFINLFLNDEFI